MQVACCLVTASTYSDCSILSNRLQSHKHFPGKVAASAILWHCWSCDCQSYRCQREKNDEQTACSYPAVTGPDPVQHCCGTFDCCEDILQTLPAWLCLLPYISSLYRQAGRHHLHKMGSLWIKATNHGCLVTLVVVYCILGDITLSFHMRSI